MAETSLPLLPLGTSSFATLRERGQIYVDKTALVYQLAAKPEKFFLTRPRRFGKSLLVNTLASLFGEGLRHFSGLAIEKLWTDKIYRVVKIDFSEAKNIQSLADFAAQMDEVLENAFEPLGFRRNRGSDKSLVKQLSAWLKEEPGNSLVLLIDEYDAPLTACLNDAELFVAVRKRLASFYAVVKSNDACWRFVFITGIAKFNQTGIFSELNIFTDISLKPAFSALLGYTEEDIDQYFGDYLKKAAEALKMPLQAVRESLREHYDGFCFDERASQRLYNPWSVLNFLSWPEDGFSNYWVASGGGLTLLQQYLHSHALKSPEEYGVPQIVSYADLSCSTDLTHLNDQVLLTQAGYLTIKERRLKAFLVGYPNREVSESMAMLYSAMLLNQKELAQVGADGIEPALRTGDIDGVFVAANRAFAAIDYARYPVTDEKSCQSCLQLFVAGAGFDVIVEKHGALGRSDLEIDADKRQWVIELKFQRKGDSADALLSEAARQVKSRNYGAASKKTLLRVAVVFSEAQRAFVAWQEVR